MDFELNLLAMRRGQRQGLSIAPADFMTVVMLLDHAVDEQGFDNNSIPGSLPSLESGRRVSEGDMVFEE